MATAAKTIYSGQGVIPVYDAAGALLQNVRLPAGVTISKGTVLGQVTSNTAANEVQTVTITGTPTGGSFNLVFAGQVTGAIAYNATAAAVQTALEALSNIGTGNVACAGGPFPGTAVTVTFQGRMANLDQPLMTTINSLTGGTTPAVAVTLTTSGNPGGAYFKAYNDGNSDGSEVAKAILQYECVVDTYGNITVGGGDYGETQKAAPAYFSGTFKTADLTGLDAAAVADLGKLISGATTTLSASTTILRIG